MASRLNSEFNYRTQVLGETPWEKIKHIKNFLVGRKRAAALQDVGSKRLEALRAELQHAIDSNALPHIILRLQADLIEQESVQDDLNESFELNKKEIACLEKYLQELYEIAEPTRIPGYSDDDMFEVNAAHEFTVMIARDIQAEVIANGRPSPAKLRNAMSNPVTFNALKQIGLIPPETEMILPSADVQNVTLISDRSEPLIADSMEQGPHSLV
ncbi:MAG: hypothetical protein BroJett040_17820 [Oligoflexia bacterium]|nr:MAG: hypothetical protein BroJett040_17820 [Oligoflexia bacterium]